MADSFDRVRCRALYVDAVKNRMTRSDFVREITDRMLDGFMRDVDMEIVARGMDFTNSYTTLHDHEFGAEILRQTDFDQRFRDFAGVGRFKELFGGDDEQLSGIAMVAFADRFASIMESAFCSRKYRPGFIKCLSIKFKETEWWKDNFNQVSRVLRRNRKRLNAAKAVMNS